MTCANLVLFRLDDEEALRGKVDEALNVYDEYMKNKGDGEATEVKPQEAAKEAPAEENKS
jgi:polyadenylate-binding protein